ncbi:DUF5343 domain-containing protein [Chloroflexota bacterium]
MSKAPYTPSPKNVSEFFNAIQSQGVPTKLSYAHLVTIGFKSSNDRYLVKLSKTLGFIDSSGTPTQIWKDFKDKAKAPKVMADAIKSAYAHLYGTYLDADNRDDQTLQNYFASTSGVADSVAKLMVQTFKNLCGFANFQSSTVEKPEPEATTPIKESTEKIPPSIQPVTININIQLQLPATENATIYESLFLALKKNLLS